MTDGMAIIVVLGKVLPGIEVAGKVEGKVLAPAKVVEGVSNRG
jgi:hypothetical protein